MRTWRFYHIDIYNASSNITVPVHRRRAGDAFRSPAYQIAGPPRFRQEWCAAPAVGLCEVGSASYAQLNFNDGAANYIGVPWVYVY